jgi:ankyrin repeat protein
VRKTAFPCILVAAFLASSAQAQDANLFELAGNCRPLELQDAIGRGADLNAREMDEVTLLMAAVYHKCAEAASLLIKAGADLNAQDVFGHSALMWAAMYGEAPDIITALLDAGADAKVKDEKGKTAFDYALENWRMAGTEVIRRLEEASR